MTTEPETITEPETLAQEREHPPITDVLGRTWTWVDGDLYRHDSMVWLARMIQHPELRWPRRSLLHNPNYAWCPRCLEHVEQWPR